MTNFVLVAGAWLGAWAWDEVAADLRTAGHGVHALTLSGLAEKHNVPAGQQTHVQEPATYVKCLLDGDEPMPAVAELLKSEHWERVDMDTGHWPMFSQPAELARILDESVRRP
ncbi:hypothetical protein SALBM311S_00059 [Streptomyces alboniger]